MIFESEALDLPSDNFHGAFHQILGVPYFQRDPVVGCAVSCCDFQCLKEPTGMPRSTWVWLATNDLHNDNASPCLI